MPSTHGANKSYQFAQIFNLYEVISEGFAQINDVLFAHVYKALMHIQNLSSFYEFMNCPQSEQIN